jgi:hypothetical protein
MKMKMSCTTCPACLLLDVGGFFDRLLVKEYVTDHRSQDVRLLLLKEEKVA